MSRIHWIAVGLAIVATVSIFFLAPTVSPEKRGKKPVADSTGTTALNIEAVEKQVFTQLSPARQQYLQGLDAEVKRGDVAAQQLKVFRAKAHFYHDSAAAPALHFYYLGKGAELENTEKSLTFAAHSILEYLPYARDNREQLYLAGYGRQLFEKALSINPANDSSIVGAGGCIMYGATGGEGGPMEGILKVRSVADRDSTNIFAQYMLGIGGVISGQIDKAVLRFEKVAAGQPDNMEVLFRLAELNERLGNTAAAAGWYETILKKVDRPDLKSELQKRIATLKKPAAKQ